MFKLNVQLLNISVNLKNVSNDTKTHFTFIDKFITSCKANYKLYITITNYNYKANYKQIKPKNVI